MPKSHRKTPRETFPLQRRERRVHVGLALDF